MTNRDVLGVTGSEGGTGMRKNGFIALGNTSMYYVSFGNGAKKLVMLPGLSDGLATVKGKAWVLASSYKGFFHDYTVYLFSRKNDMPERYSIADMADDQVQVMHQLGIGKACVLGVSQGGMIAQSIAIRHPEMVDRLILAVTAPSANDIAKENVTAWISMAKRGDHKHLMIDTAEKTYSKKYLDKNRKLLPLLALFTKPSSYERFFRNADAILHFDVRKELPMITAPTLIIAGSDDKTVGNHAAEELKQGIFGGKLFVYEGLGHGAYEEAKDFYDRVLAFYNQ